jgi:ABC-type antimicrobial peptide transport system permease subunit
VPPGFVPEGVSPVPSFYALNVALDRVNETLTELSELKGTFLVETAQMTVFAERLLDQFAYLPLAVAALALFASGTIMANTTSLATLERRRQIGVMKALGLQTERVLVLLLLENGLIGLAASVIGVALGTIAIDAFNLLGEGSGNLPIGTVGLLVALAVGLSLVATLLTAYGAAREKPLHVLRYE